MVTTLGDSVTDGTGSSFSADRRRADRRRADRRRADRRRADRRRADRRRADRLADRLRALPWTAGPAS
ncbi:hypothetical protein [Streptomyces sp. NPDC005141]